MNRRHLLGLTLVLLTMSAGCDTGSVTPKKPLPRVPTSGVVRLDGKPLVGAVVVFLPTDENGTLTQSETDEQGHYDLTYANMPGGTSPGSYRVSISYLVAPNGEPQGLGPRSSLVPSRDYLTAKELLPPKYSDPGRSEFTVTVPAKGRTFDFELKGPLLPLPAPDDSSAEPLNQGNPVPPPALQPPPETEIETTTPEAKKDTDNP